DFPSLPRFDELLKEKHLLISKHTLRYLKQEFYLPGSVIDRASRARWQEEGGKTLLERGQGEVEKLIGKYEPSRLPDDKKSELTKLMEGEARRYGMERLPQIDL
ncbi:MAG: trimethylamine methyltransferase family protein, partial [Candidatus Zixiibacteriota bacterium]